MLGEDVARAGLDRLGGFPPGMAVAEGIGGASYVGLLDSTLYLRNQVLRDSDWASMAHSLELRTPFVDVPLLATLGPHAAAFTGGMGKAMLAHAPDKCLPQTVVNRRKTGFSVPMASWLSKRSDHRSWSDMASIAPAGMPWARRWAKMVVDRMTGCV